MRRGGRGGVVPEKWGEVLERPPPPQPDQPRRQRARLRLHRRHHRAETLQAAVGAVQRHRG